MANEKRLIDAKRLKMRMIAFATAIKREYLSIEAIVDTINTEDTVEAVEVVRCKDCKHCRTASWGEKYCVRKQLDGAYAELSNLRDDDFCSYGERRTE